MLVPIDHVSGQNTAVGRVLPVGATTAEKLEWTSRGANANPLSFRLPSLSRLPLLLHLCSTHSLPYSSFLPLKLARRSGEALWAKKKQPVAKVGGTEYTWGPHNLQIWRGRVPRVLPYRMIAAVVFPSVCFYTVFWTTIDPNFLHVYSSEKQLTWDWKSRSWIKVRIRAKLR